MSETKQLSELERNTLMMLLAYPDGVGVDLTEFKPELVYSLHDLAKRGFCSIEPLEDGNCHLQLSATGRDFCENYNPPGS